MFPGMRDALESRREVAVALVALLLFATVLSVLQYWRLRERQHEELFTQAGIVAQTVSAALVFDSRDDAGEILSAFERSPSIRHAHLTRADGRVFTTFTHTAPEQDGLESWLGADTVSVPVLAGGARIGELVVEASLAPMWADLAGFIGAALGILAATAGLAWGLSKRLRAEMHAAQQRTRYLARFDALTDLPNREQMRQLLERGLRHEGGCSLMILDLDNFKQINDQHGHAAGDTVLQATGQRLRELCPAGGDVARLSADEFAVLLVPGRPEAALRQFAAQLQASITAPVRHDDNWLPVSASVGGVMLPDQASEPGEAMRCADAAMRHAKQQGKDGFQLFTAEIGEALRSRLALEEDLRHALALGQLSLAYQPQYDAELNICGFEALARWHHPERGWISPAHFIPVAEASGLIVELGLGMLALLRRDLDAWQAQGLACPPIAVNLSWAQCRKPQHRDRLLQALQQHRLGPDQIEFELTESAIFEDLDKPDSFVYTLQGLGYALAIDDFGTGYSSLAYLRRMRCRKLKIDRLFIHGLANSSDARMLVESIIRVAHAMRMVVVAEGVELETDRAVLVEMHCDLLQGFGLSRPLTPDQAAPLLPLGHTLAGTLGA